MTSPLSIFGFADSLPDLDGERSSDIAWVIAFALALVMAAPVNAVQINATWIGSSDGLWTDSNWSYQPTSNAPFPNNNADQFDVNLFDVFSDDPGFVLPSSAPSIRVISVFADNSHFTIDGGMLLTDAGFKVDEGNFYIRDGGNLTVGGTLSVGHSTADIDGNGSVLTANKIETGFGGSYISVNDGALLNAGLVTIGDPDPQELDEHDVFVDNGRLVASNYIQYLTELGTTVRNNGELDVANLLQLDGGKLTIEDGIVRATQVQVNSIDPIVGEAKIVGYGQILSPPGPLDLEMIVQGGTISPSPGLQAEVLTVGGDLDFRDGQLKIQISSLAKFSRLDVVGVANFTGGEILIEFIDEFLPDAGDIVEFLTSAELFVDYTNVEFGLTGGIGGFAIVPTSEGALQFRAITDFQIPEPMVLTLLCIGFAGIALGRCRNNIGQISV